MGLLDGVRVLDLSRVLAGPYCTAMLADLGADVVKVEPVHGDDARHLGPFVDGESVYFAQLNRGKRSLALDLKDADDHALFRSLAARADVVVENFRPGVAAKLGVDYATLSADSPGLVYASISGFGQDGPLSHLPAYDLVVQAMSGLMAATGQPAGPPTRTGESLGDLCAGMFAAWGICAALFARERTGRGRHLDVAMLDSLVAMQVTAMSLLTATGRLPGRTGNRHPVSAPFDTFQAADGPVAIAVASDSVFARLAQMLGKPALATHERFAADTARTENRELLRGIIEAWTQRRSVSEVVAAAERAGVPAGPIWDLAEAVGSEQVRGRGLVADLEHPELGALRYLKQPVRFGDADERPSPRTPRLGEHAEDVRREWLR
ncbi:CaiB/BaiF CoA transferase family protein [Saccharopolyspora elongata]|uniref:CoA transferase n=1 Tax=Saccharopolyspora elongata TaxID=2530387 RepID=A0A4R4Z6H2_9PSEU|nr:CoA transferase [Saccharopolyspora elongata]TDD53150.1 CoA transferase [Saccharopolyspora elongata]